jgi:hypothetical protein
MGKVIIVGKQKYLGQLLDDLIASKRIPHPWPELGEVKFSTCQHLEWVPREEAVGNFIVGVIPLHLAPLAKAILSVVLATPSADKGQVLSLDQLKQYYKGAYIYECTSRRLA